MGNASSRCAPGSPFPGVRILRLVFVTLISVSGPGFVEPSQAQIFCTGDCNGDNVVQLDELVDAIAIKEGELDLAECVAADPSGNAKVDAAEVIQATNHALHGCPTPPSTVLAILIHNDTGISDPTFTVTGHCKRGMNVGVGRETSYSMEFDTCGSTECLHFISFTQMVCEWVHSVEVPSTGQRQSQKMLQLSSTTINMVEWRLFKNVEEVNKLGDAGDGNCDATCTLRDAVSAANANPGPTLIQFNHEALKNSFGVAEIFLGPPTPTPGGAGPTPTLAPIPQLSLERAITIDGTDSLGNPCPLQPFIERTYPTVITIGPTGSNRANSGRLRVFSDGVELIGLKIQRILAPDAVVGGDKDLITFGGVDPGTPTPVPGQPTPGSSRNGLVRNCLLDGGAAARTLQDKSGVDGIDVENNHSTTFDESSAAGPVVIDNSEIRHCYDRPLKSSNAYAIIEDSWIHNNIRGGPFVQTEDMLAGHLRTRRNLIEQNGRNCPTPVPSGFGYACGSQGTIRMEASQLSIEPGGGTLEALGGDVLRNGENYGILYRADSSGSVKDTYVCDMVQHGLEAASSVGPLSIRGLASVLNLRGVELNESSGDVANADFGDLAQVPPSPGNNAFTQNSNENFRSLVDPTPGAVTIKAEGNQWENCGTTGTCSIATIQTADIDGAVDVDPAQAHRAPAAPLAITNVYPSKVSREGQLVFIFGQGFNAIDGYAGAVGFPSGGATTCGNLTAGNSCSPNRGVCVEFIVDGVPTPVDEIVAVTPTLIVVRSSIECKSTASIRVKQWDSSNAPHQTTFAFCNNSNP